MRDLPVAEVLPPLIDALRSQGRAVLQAPPGAGKTTLVPIALFEAGLFGGKIIMLEPRRLATRAAAERLSELMGEKPGQTVGYRMRGDTKTSARTKIEVVTEGVLTRMIQNDPELSGISCIIFDEFHERALQADLGLALSLEIRGALRPDLAILVMSATLDAAPVAKLMDDAPMITSQGRSFPVEYVFLDQPWSRPGSRARFDGALADLVVKAHAEQKGDILVFLPGAGEINRVAQALSGRLDDTDIRPLYGALPFKEQRAAIQPGPKRRVVLATSIAETSLTIEGITTVVDGGQARRAAFDRHAGMGRLVTTKVTKAEATQRAGRAGRLGPGTCYKLWTKGEDSGLKPFPDPEILATDLMPLVLELVQWGAAEPSDLPFLTQPRSVDVDAARDVLHDLGALDPQGGLTALGQEMARLPTHPRLARALLDGGASAAALAALIENRDPLIRGRGAPLPADVTLRIEAAQDRRRFEAERPFKTSPSALQNIQTDTKRLLPHAKGALSTAEAAALAYPDRIALRRKGDAPRYLLSGGAGAALPEDDPLAGQRMLVALDLDGDTREAQIRLAAPITEAQLKALYPARITTRHICQWNSRQRKVEARAQTCFGALVLTEQGWPDCPPEARAKAMIDGIRDLGLGALPFDAACDRFRARVALIRRADPEFPDLSDDALLNDLEMWAMPLLLRVNALDAIKPGAVLDALKSGLDWAQTQKLDSAAPAHFTAPTGTKTPVDYSDETPRIAVRLQELFGLKDHPVIGPARVPITLDLLSPAGRIVQTTTDLPGFWATSYADVRKDMRGRYPRHPWPENPADAQATRRAKPRRN